MRIHAVKSMGPVCTPTAASLHTDTERHRFSSPGVTWPPLGWCLLTSPHPGTATRGCGAGRRCSPHPPQDSPPQAQQPPTSLTPLVRRGEGVSPATGILPRATVPSTAGGRDASRRGAAKPQLTPVPGGQRGRQGAGRGCREDRKFLTHQFYRETPSSAAGWCLHGLCG